MRIDIYNFDNGVFHRVGTTEKAHEITYNLDYHSISDFSLKIPLYAKYADLIKEGVFLHINKEFWGIVNGELESDYTSEVLSAKGVDLKGLLNRRIIIPVDYTSTDGTAGYMTINGSTEKCIKYLWQMNAGEPPQQFRKIPGMVINPNKDLGEAADKYMARFELLDEATKKLCEAANLGYKSWIDLTDNSIYFDVYKGVDRTESQTENPRAIFEISRKNIGSLEYSINQKNYKNAFYSTQSGAEFQDEALTLLYYRDDIEQSGFERREKHLSISAQDPPAGEEYNDLKRLTQIEMRNHDTEEGFFCELSPVNGYKAKWDVGDMVTIKDKKSGLIADVRITGVTIAATGAETKHIAKFGNQKPRFIAVGDNIFKV